MTQNHQVVNKILANYNSENSGVKRNLYNILMSGRLAGTGRIIILPVDQGMEHGPIRSFAKNPLAYNPDYHFNLAIKARLSAYAAPLGFLEAGIDKFIGQIPIILKMNSSNSLYTTSQSPDQAFTSSISDALRLGCSAVGLTIYPGSSKALEMIEEAREIVKEAKSCGLAVVIWSYPRGKDLTKEGENAIDICAYGAHLAASIGANIIKVKIPSTYIVSDEAKEVYASQHVTLDNLKDRIAIIVQSCFNGRRIVIFSGGNNRNSAEILSEIEAIKLGGGNGSIMGRNLFQRVEDDALQLVNLMMNIYLSE
ncbi:MAG: class I fructose-bisphosphate aldolase [Rickettsiaceae bacterium]|nr:MAG: class I fructose-bisphosphate aldolase [Rickettsiaceae bacterium]